jgi:sugar fermentation stimulation protein A
MKFTEKLVHGTLIRRYKRFLADIRLDNGEVVVAHCTNSGSMKSCIEEGAEVYVSPVTDPSRKTRFTWEMIRIGGNWIGINTSHPNRLVFEALEAGQLEGFGEYKNAKREVTFEDSRFDVYAESENSRCFFEVKNVTLREGRYALFPDAVTVRGRKHLETLVRARQAGFRAVMVYVVQRMDVEIFSPAREIDPDYAAALENAVRGGIETVVVYARVTPESINLAGRLPVEI